MSWSSAIVGPASGTPERTHRIPCHATKHHLTLPAPTSQLARGNRQELSPEQQPLKLQQDNRARLIYSDPFSLLPVKAVMCHAGPQELLLFACHALLVWFPLQRVDTAVGHSAIHQEQRHLCLKAQRIGVPLCGVAPTFAHILPKGPPKGRKPEGVFIQIMRIAHTGRLRRSWTSFSFLFLISFPLRGTQRDEGPLGIY